MLPLLARDRLFWRLRPSGRSLEETRHRAGWKVARIQGPVVIGVIIGKDGNIQSEHLISGDSLLARAAMDAVKKWKYRPYILNRNPVEVDTQITVNFTLTPN